MGRNLISCHVMEQDKTFLFKEKYLAIRKNFDVIFVDLEKYFD